jgi:hypothetical protein
VYEIQIGTYYDDRKPRSTCLRKTIFSECWSIGCGEWSEDPFKSTAKAYLVKNKQDAQLLHETLKWDKGMIARTIVGIFVFIAVWCMSLQWDREAQTSDHTPAIYKASSVIPHIGLSEAEAKRGGKGKGKGNGYSAGPRSGKSWVRKATRSRTNKSIRRKEIRQYKTSSIVRNGVPVWRKAGIARVIPPFLMGV